MEETRKGKVVLSQGIRILAGGWDGEGDSYWEQAKSSTWRAPSLSWIVMPALGVN